MSQSNTYYVDDPDSHEMFTESSCIDNQFISEPDMVASDQKLSDANGEFTLKVNRI